MTDVATDVPSSLVTSSSSSSESVSSSASSASSSSSSSSHVPSSSSSLSSQSILVEPLCFVEDRDHGLNDTGNESETATDCFNMRAELGVTSLWRSAHVGDF